MELDRESVIDCSPEYRRRLTRWRPTESPSRPPEIVSANRRRSRQDSYWPCVPRQLPGNVDPHRGDIQSAVAVRNRQAELLPVSAAARRCERDQLKRPRLRITAPAQHRQSQT